MTTICRACLSSDGTLQPIDNNFIQGYNALTNLTINLSDGLPQYTCTDCLANVIKFLIFKDKCLESENTLHQVLKETIDSKAVQFETDIKDEVTCKPESDKHILLEKFDGSDELDEIKDKDLELICQEINLKLEEDENLSGSGINDEDLGEYNIKVVLNEKKDNKPKRQNEKVKGTTKKCNDIEKNDNVFCGLCSKEFETMEQLKEHLEFHKFGRVCSLCHKKFLEWPSLLAHRILHITNLKEKICHICEKRFKCVYRLELHYRNSHYNGEKALTCEYCKKKNMSAKNLKRHIKTAHLKSQVYQCDYCKKMVASKHGLITHLRKHSDEKPFKCDLCEFSCKYRSGLKAHKLRKHSDTKMKYCTKCKRQFIDGDTLKNHDCKVRATICPICGVVKTKLLNEHMATHHFGGSFKCNLCPSEFKSKSGLKVHHDKHSGIKRYGCEFCNMRFYSPSVLIKHRRVHTGEKPYVCKVCSRGFTGNHNLKVHMKVHGEDLVVKRVNNTSLKDAYG